MRLGGKPTPDSTARQRTLTAYLFLAPALVALALFTFYPIAYGIYLAFTDYDMLRHTPQGVLVPPRFVGLDNFAKLYRDPYFWTALTNSALYLLVVPVLQVLAMAVAVLVNQRIAGVRLFRTTYYIPVVTSVVVVGIAWNWVYQSDGPLNALLVDVLGLPRVGWLTDGRVALFSVMLVTVWQGLGYFMMLYLAGLQGIPPEYEEAARLDGAGPWLVFRHVTVPLLRPTLALCSVISCISAFKVFTEIYVMTRGGPEHATLTLGYLIFDTAFKDYAMGYAAALSLVMGIFVGVISYVNLRYFREGGLTYYA
ncbi:MAG: sugar ABC transporter permease [Armatimonadetes bacterium]|nr:sugar ABC transporter permease [Armatimonadota bacterium]